MEQLLIVLERETVQIQARREAENQLRYAERELELCKRWARDAEKSSEKATARAEAAEREVASIHEDLESAVASFKLKHKNPAAKEPMPNGVLFARKSSHHTQTEMTLAAAGAVGQLWLWAVPKWAVGAIAALLLSIYVAAAVTTYVTLDQTTTFEPVCTAGGGATEFKLNLTFSPFEVPSDVTDSYVCEAMELPDDGCAYHVTEFNPLETTPFVHHMILFGVIQELRPKCTVACFDMPGQVTILYAWAVGGDKMRLPPNVGLRVGKGTSHELSTLQMHYNNPLGVAGAVDSSGVELTLTSELREHDMSMVMSGVPTNDLVRIPPGQTRFIIEASVELRLAAPAKTFAVGLHAHEAGIRIEAWLVREGVVVASLGVENPYNFQNQDFHQLAEEVELLPGDRVRIRCEYDTTSRSSCTQGGDKSSQEMCLHFMAVYPATSVAEMAVLESSFTEYVSDDVAAWSAMRSMEEWPAEVQAEVNLATGDSSGGATCAPGSVLACSLVLMPGLTLEWVVDGAKMVGRLTLETAGAWLAVGLAGDSGGDLMTGGWAVVGEFGDGGGAHAYDLTGMSRSLLVEDTSGARLLSANVTEVDGAGQLWFEVAMNDGFNGGATATTLIAAHGDAPQLAYHFTKKTHASVVLDAAPAATKEIVLKPSGDPEYNPCFG